MRIVPARSVIVGGVVALALAIGAAGILASDDVGEALAQTSGYEEEEVEGLIEAMPATGVVGTWQVAGRTVTVTEATEIDLEGQTLAVGVRVEVEGVVQADGSIAASEIEVEDDD
jgi:hypothetical protein